MKSLLGAIVLMLATSGLAQAQPAAPSICVQAAAEALNAGRDADAVAILRPCAEQGDAFAQGFLGTMYAYGRGVPQDYVEAVRWYRLAAEQGDAFAQTNLGIMYNFGRGVPQDYVEAVRWYRLAAEQGDAKGQTNLGIMYNNGQGVPQDFILAHMWFNIAAANGEAVAATNRDRVAARMTTAQIAEAQRLAREWFAAHPN